MANSHVHSPSHANPPHTEGNVIHWAGLYRPFSFWLRVSEKRILELARIEMGDKVLDLGCGPGSLTIRAKKKVGQNGQVYGLDPSPEMIALAQRNAKKVGQAVDFRLGVAEALPFETGTLDVVLSRLVFHHLPGELRRQALTEIRRVLKPGGYCLVVDFEPPVLNLPKFLKKPSTGTHGMMSVDVKAYLPLFEESGFKEIESGPTGHRLLSFVRGRS